MTDKQKIELLKKIVAQALEQLPISARHKPLQETLHYIDLILHYKEESK